MGTVIEEKLNYRCVMLSEPNGHQAMGYEPFASGVVILPGTVLGAVRTVADDEKTYLVPWKALDPDANDGSEIARGIALGYIDTTPESPLPPWLQFRLGRMRYCPPGLEELAVNWGLTLLRNCEVRLGMLIWPDGIDGTQKATALQQLKDLGIIARSS